MRTDQLWLLQIQALKSFVPRALECKVHSVWKLLTQCVCDVSFCCMQGFLPAAGLLTESWLCATDGSDAYSRSMLVFCWLALCEQYLHKGPFLTFSAASACSLLGFPVVQAVTLGLCVLWESCPRSWGCECWWCGALLCFFPWAAVCKLFGFCSVLLGSAASKSLHLFSEEPPGRRVGCSPMLVWSSWYPSILTNLCPELCLCCIDTGVQRGPDVGASNSLQ